MVSRNVTTIILALAAVLSAAAVTGGEFIHGIYAVPVKEKDVAAAKQMGFTHIHNYNNPHTETGLKTAEEQLDLAQKYGLKVLFNLSGHKLVGKPDAVDRLMSVIRKFRKHPALAAWYLCDEPSTPEQERDLKLFYQILKRETPEIPVFLCLCQNEPWRNFTEPCDVLMGDLYPVRDETFPEAPLHEYLNFMRQLGQRKKSWAAVAQFMCWTAYPKLSAKYDKQKLRYPNAAELRCFFYGPLAMGGLNGVFWYSYHDLFNRGRQDGQANLDFRQTAGPLIGEFKSFSSLLKNPAEPKIFRWAEENQFQLALFDGTDGKQYLVLVNFWPVKRRFNRSTEHLIPGNAGLKPWGTTRKTNIRIRNGKFVMPDDFILPWETMIWELEKEAAH